MGSRRVPRVRHWCLVLGLAALLAPPRASGGGYIYQTIDVPGAAGGTYPIGVNADGLVAGYYADSAGADHAFTWQAGKVTPVDYTGVSGVTATFLFQVNAAGQAAGYYTGADGHSHSLIYNVPTGTWTTIPDAPGNYAFNAAGGINDVGQLAGNYTNDATNYTNLVGWLYDIKTNTYTTFTVPQADPATGGTATYAMNNKGDIVGYYTDAAGAYHGFVWDPTTGASTFDVPGATGGTIPLGLNDAGTVVGQYLIGSTSYGFIRDSGGHVTPLSLPFSGVTSVALNGIDDRGDIVGAYEDSDKLWHGFYGQAVPEPGSLALMAAGLVGLAYWTRRRR